MLENPQGLVPLQAYLLLASLLFCIGVWGLINSRNAVRVLMSIELMLNAVNINLMAFSSYLDGDLIRKCFSMEKESDYTYEGRRKNAKRKK